MVKASNEAERIFTSRPMIATERTDKNIPKCKASVGCMLPLGIGLFLVRVITKSISLSYHILIAPEAPEAIAMHRTAIIAITGCIVPGARYIPINPVNITRLITRGLSRVI